MPCFMAENQHPEKRADRAAEERNAEENRFLNPPRMTFRFQFVDSVEKKRNQTDTRVNKKQNR